jgi:hypothetical protein
LFISFVEFLPKLVWKSMLDENEQCLLIVFWFTRVRMGMKN